MQFFNIPICKNNIPWEVLIILCFFLICLFCVGRLQFSCLLCVAPVQLFSCCRIPRSVKYCGSCCPLSSERPLCMIDKVLFHQNRQFSRTYQLVTRFSCSFSSHNLHMSCSLHNYCTILEERCTAVAQVVWLDAISESPGSSTGCLSQVFH